jgi:hypothetical protein
MGIKTDDKLVLLKMAIANSRKINTIHDLDCGIPPLNSVDFENISELENQPGNNLEITTEEIQEDLTPDCNIGLLTQNRDPFLTELKPLNAFEPTTKIADHTVVS